MKSTDVVTKIELEKLHKKHSERIEDWQFFTLTYDGGRAFIQHVINRKNPRETAANFKARRDEAVNFNYARSIIDLFSFYLCEKAPIRNINETKLANNELWDMFSKDCDQSGTDWNDYMNEAERRAAITGTFGMLLIKPKHGFSTRQAEIANGIYPYLAGYGAQSILDWRYGTDPATGRRCLEYLKLREEDGDYLLYWPEAYKRVRLEKGENSDSNGIKLIDNGTNTLGEIPFVWLPNIRDITSPNIGASDLQDIAPIVASLVRDLSHGSEVIKWAAFPMLRHPKKSGYEISINTATGKKAKDVPVGQKSVLQFDPKDGESGKPDWLESVVLDPIEAVLKWMDRKVDEIFRMAHLSGVHGQRKSNNEVSSGVALRYEFQQLTSVLTRKAKAVSEAERQIIYFWCKWQQVNLNFGKLDIKREKEFSIDDLAM
ncbi:MAG: phage portal protein, partial [Pseudomonadota bacterium]